MFIVPVSRQLARSPRSIDRLFDDTFERFFGAATTPAQATVRPALDVAETDAHYTVTLDLPGVAKEDVKVSIDGKRISIEAQAQAVQESKPEGDTAKAEGPRVLYRERAAARYARSIVLPAEPEQAESSAKLENGVLTLTLTKKRSAQPRQLTVN